MGLFQIYVILYMNSMKMRIISSNESNLVEIDPNEYVNELNFLNATFLVINNNEKSILKDPLFIKY